MSKAKNFKVRDPINNKERFPYFPQETNLDALKDENYARDTRYDMFGNLLYNRVSKDTMDDYKTRLAKGLMNEGIDCDYVNDNSNAKELISKWVEDNITSRDLQNKIMGITYKFSYLDLDKHSKAEENERNIYPIINKYQGHNLVDTTYFVMDKNGALDARVIPLKKSKIII